MISGQSIMSLEHCTLWKHQQQVADSVWAQVEIPTTVENASWTSDLAKRSWLLSLTRKSKACGLKGNSEFCFPKTLNVKGNKTHDFPWGQFIPLFHSYQPEDRTTGENIIYLTLVAHKFIFVSRCTTWWTWVESSSCFLVSLELVSFDPWLILQ